MADVIFFVADVIATAVLADVIARWLMLNPPMGVCGRCYGHWAIKEALFIRVNDPSLNRNIG